MDRKEFLRITWNKAIKPIMIILLIAFILRYIYRVFTESGTERIITISIFGFAFLGIISYALGVLFSKAVISLKSKLTDKTRFQLRVIQKIVNFMGTIAFGALLYHFFLNDWIQATIISGLCLILYAIDIIKKEKTILSKTKVGNKGNFCTASILRGKNV